MPRIKFEVTGKVQGVYFRVHAVQKATSLGVTGWIRNNQQGSVEGEAQHKEKAKLDGFVRWLGYEGSPASKIDQCKIEDIQDKDEETEFQKIKNQRWTYSA